MSSHYPSREARWLTRVIFEELKGWTQVDMAIRAEEELSDFMVSEVTAVVERLLADEPIQYIFGRTTFYGIRLKVDRNTLIPRQETEELVDMIVDDASGREDLHVLDVGTGSGCIAIALARNLRFPVVEAIDISVGAVAVAKENAETNRAKVKFRVADGLSPEGYAGSYDIIVSNPPYVADSEAASMSANVLAFEPHTALFVPDSNPLMFYKAICENSFGCLKEGGRIYFEVNPLFADELKRWMTERGWQDVELRRDMQKQIRFLTARR